MESEFQNAIGKSAGEVMRDIADFLEHPQIIQKKNVDLRYLLADLNMQEQFSFALLSEAVEQGWEMERMEQFYRRACGGCIKEETINSFLQAFQNPDGAAFLAYQKKYGCYFSLLDGSYWATCLAVGIECDCTNAVMDYLRLFTVCLMEFAYMDDRNPERTYTWNYYESFRAMLDDIIRDPEQEPLPLKIKSIGGSAGAKKEGSYHLTLGVDIENPNPERMATDISLDIILKDAEGNIITVVRDKLYCIDPGTVYHYGVTKKITGRAVGSIAAVAKAKGYLKLQLPLMKHVELSNLKLVKIGDAMQFKGNMTSRYQSRIGSLMLHYQFVDADFKLLGGGSEWISDGIDPQEIIAFQSKASVAVPRTAKVLYSIDFDAMELI